MTDAAEEPVKPKRSRAVLPPDERNMRAHLERINVWSHRCYSMARKKGGGWKCRNMFAALSDGLPARFEWSQHEDRDGLKRYIDSLLLGRLTESTQIENSGFVTNIEHEPIQRPEDQLVSVNIKRLLDYFLLRDQFHVPLWGKVKFVTNKKVLIPVEFMAAMAQVLTDNGMPVDATDTWSYAMESDLAEMGLKPEDVTSSMNREQFSSLPGGGPATAASADVREERVGMRHFPRHFELLTQAFPEEGPAFFTRRLMLYGSGKELWVGTSFNEKGPWHVWSRSTSELVALGLTPD